MSKKVVTVGVYDIFHLGHFNFLENASRYGDELIVGVHDDVNFSKGVDFLYSLKDRMRIVGAFDFVSEARRYVRVDKFLEEVEFDVFAHGPDQDHEYFQVAKEYCLSNGKEVVEVPRTEGISSTQLRRFLDEKKTSIKG